MKAKKILAGALSMAMILSMAACGSGNDSTTAAPKTDAATTAAETTAAEGTTAAAEGTTAAGGSSSSMIDKVDAANLPEVQLTIASSASSTNEGYGIQEAAAKELSEMTDGKLNVKLSWDGVLGGDGELAESCMAGSIDMISMATSPLLSYIPEIAVFDMPAVFESPEAAYEGVKNFKDSFQSIFNAKQMQLIGLGFSNFRGLSTNKEIKTADDFKEMTIRVMENKYHTAFWENLGAKPTPLAFSDLYMALQQGLVQAQDNPITAVYASKFYEVQDYYMPITAFPMVNVIAINKDTYDALPAEYQKALEQFADAFLQRSYEQNTQIEENAFAAIGDGITTLDFTADIFTAMQEAAKPVWETIKSDIGEEMPNAYLAAGGIQ